MNMEPRLQTVGYTTAKIQSWKIKLKVSAISFHKKFELSTIDTKFPDDGAITIKLTLNLWIGVSLH